MKTSQRAALSAAVIAIGALAPSTRPAPKPIPPIPVGSLVGLPDGRPDRHQAHPHVEHQLSVDRRGFRHRHASRATVTPKENLICEIRMLGLGVTSQDSNGSITYYRTRARIRYNGSSSWTDIYDGKQTDTNVQQQEIVKTYNVNRNKAINFGGQYYNNSAWQTFYTSLSGDNVRTLVNGDTRHRIFRTTTPRRWRSSSSPIWTPPAK